MKPGVFLFTVVCLLLHFSLVCPCMAAAGIIFPENEYDFGQRWQGDTITHTFRIKNAGERALTIQKQEMTGPFTSARFKSSLPPGQEMDVVLSVDTIKYTGAVDTGIVLHTDDPKLPSMTFRIRGKVNPILTFHPLHALFFSAYKGEMLEKSIDIINNYTEPLVITKIESKSDRFSVRLETIKEGQEYRLSAKLNPKASLGRTREAVTFFTDSSRIPKFSVGVNILVKDDVYTFPDEIDFGTIDLDNIRKNPQLLSLLNQTILVKRREGKGTDFQINLEQALTFLSIKKDPESGSETYNIDVSLIPEKMTRGKIDSFIRVRTNDKVVPEIKIPVRGEIR